jgi:predicted amidohydrolase YtcJ
MFSSLSHTGGAMSKGPITRKDFLGLSAMLAGALGTTKVAAPSAPWRAEPGPPMQQRGGGIEADLIVVNARVLTQDTALPRAEAFAVKDGRFLAVGSNADIRNLATSRTRVIDGARMCVVPGFIDCHNHPSGVSELFEANANVRTLAELQANLRARLANTPEGFWITGVMFDDTKLDVPLTKAHLDAVSTRHPIAVRHRGGHTGFYNSLAFELAGVTRDTPDPDHGRFFRDASGAHNGRAAEHALDVLDRVGKREQFTPEQRRARGRQGMAHISKLMTASGLTTVHSAGSNAASIRSYEDARADGALRHRAYLMIRGAYTQLRDAGIHTGFGDDMIRIGGVKYAADGSASERTMRMSTPYVGTDDYGILTMTQQEIHEAVDDAHRNNWQVGIHANGDVAIEMVLNAYERALAQWPHADRRHRIEHCSQVNPSILARIAKAGVIPTPFWTYVYYHGEKWEQYGDEKMRWMFAHRSFLDSGIRVVGASDYGPGPFEPLMALQSMVTRKDYRGKEWGPNQKVTVDEALRIATVNGAYASYEERTKGTITAGKLADFVILEKDPHDVPPDTIKDIRVVRTVVGGRTVHPELEPLS